MKTVPSAHIVTYESYTKFRLVCDYAAYQKLNYEFPKYGIIVDASDFGGSVTLRLAIKSTRFAEFSAKLAEMLAGNVNIEELGERFDFR